MSAPKQEHSGFPIKLELLIGKDSSFNAELNRPGDPLRVASALASSDQVLITPKYLSECRGFMLTDGIGTITLRDLIAFNQNEEINKGVHIGMIIVQQGTRKRHIVQGGDVITTMFPNLKSYQNSVGKWFLERLSYLSPYEAVINIMGLGSKDVVGVTERGDVEEFEENSQVILVDTASLQRKK